MRGLNALIMVVNKNYNLRTAKRGKNETTGEQPSGDNKGDGGLEFVPVNK